MKKVITCVLCIITAVAICMTQNNITLAAGTIPENQPTYQGDGYKLEYPSHLILNTMSETASAKGVMLLSRNYKGEGKNTPTWDVVQSGFKIAVEKKVVPAGWDWIWLAIRDGTESLGKRILEKIIITENSALGYKMVEEGRLYLCDRSIEGCKRQSKIHTLTTVTLHNQAKGEVVIIWLLTRKSDNKKYAPILDKIINSFQWMEE